MILVTLHESVETISLHNDAEVESIFRKATVLAPGEILILSKPALPAGGIPLLFVIQLPPTNTNNHESMTFQVRVLQKKVSCLEKKRYYVYCVAVIAKVIKKIVL
jgi:hypothetical protein